MYGYDILQFMLTSGVMDVRGFLDEGLKVAIGTDVAGGYSASMLDAIRQVLYDIMRYHI